MSLLPSPTAFRLVGLPLLLLSLMRPAGIAETTAAPVVEPVAPAYHATLNGQPLPASAPIPEATPTPAPTATPAIADPLLEASPTIRLAPAAPNAPAPAPTMPDLSPPPNLDPLQPPVAPQSPSQNVTINLINRLVQKGVLTKEDAAELIQQAEADAEFAKAQAAATQDALTLAAAAQMAADQATAPPPDDSVRVTYIPDVVKTQIREQLKVDVMTQAREEGWAAPRMIPSWVSKIKPFADIRVRFEGDFFPAGNDNTGAFPNFNAINTGSPFDVTGNQFSPQYNVDQDRNRLRLRARFGANIDLGEHFSTGFRLATGESNSPVSANQSLGLANQGQGGNFSKYAIWLDRAFIKYQLTGNPHKDLSLTVGRFDNPFFTISDIMWANDIGFDGFALQAEYQITQGFTPFFNAGAFPVFNTDFNFSTNQPSKFKSYDKWLYAAQLGSNWKITDELSLTTATAYYYFHNVEGQLSSPFTPLSAQDAGDTDDSRPSFAQKGNTYMALRDIVPDASNDYGTTNQWQYFGLATPYQNLGVNAKLDYTHFEPVVISLMGEFIANLAFDKSAINDIAVNNRGATDDDLSDSIGGFEGGNLAWIVQTQIGSPALAKRWDWNVAFGYRWVESDAVVDGFTGSDFGGGGTNLKGYTIGGNVALSANVWFGVRWLSATSIAGPTYKEDIIQFDLNAKF